MLIRKMALGLAGLCALIAAGCGGSTGSLPSPPVNNLTIAGDATFNGSNSAVSGGSSTTTEVAGSTVIVATAGARTLRVTVPTTTIFAGDVFNIGGEGGASATYTETRNRDSIVYAWVANSGTLTFTTATDGAIVATVDIDGMHFVADVTIDGNPAMGSFTMTGTVGGVPVDVHGGAGGSVNLSFSNVVGTAVNSAAMTSGTITFTASDSLGNTLVASSGSGTDMRTFTFYTPPSVTAGTEFDLTGHGSNFGYCMYSQGDGMEWIATGGKMKLVSKTGTTATYQLTNASFVAANAGTSGTFTVNGTAARE